MTYEIDKKTSEIISILKGILIILVVFIHAYRERVTFLEGNVILHAPRWLEMIKYLISQLTARSAVPAFFVVSAVLLYRKEFTWKENMRKKVYSILVPYFILNTFWILFFYLAQKSEFVAAYFVTPQSQVGEWDVSGWLEAYFGYVMDPYPILYPTWFLRDLFLLNIVAGRIKRCVDAFPGLVLMLLACVWLLPLPIPYIGKGTISGQSLVFFVLGYYVVKYGIRMELLEKYSGWRISGVYCFMVLLTILTREMVVGYTIRNLTLAVGIIWLVKISQLVADSFMKASFLLFSKHSFFVFAFHEMGLTILMKMIARWNTQTWQVQLLEYFGLPVFVIAVCVLTSSVFRTIMPGLYGVLTGHRNGK